MKIAINKKITLNINPDSTYAVSITAFYVIRMLDECIKDLVGRTFLHWDVFTLLFYLLNFMLLLYYFLVVEKNIFSLVSMEIVVAIAFLISYLGGYLVRESLSTTIFNLMVGYIPIGVAASLMINRKELFDRIYKAALILSPIMIITAIFSYNKWQYTYDMVLGYNMIFSALILVSHFLDQKKIYDLFVSFVLIVMTLFVGSRGPFICLIAYVVLYVVVSKQLTYKSKIIFLLLIAIALGLIYLNFSVVLNFLVDLSNKFGFNSRSLVLLIQGNAITHDSGRKILQDHYWELIRRKPYVGYGIMGNWINSENYPHNIAIELILSFGYPVAMLFIAFIFYKFICGLRSNDRVDSLLSIIFVSYCTSLLVSNSFLRVWQFFVCLGLCRIKYIKVGSLRSSLISLGKKKWK